MDNNMEKVIDYFRPPRDYFWRWAEGGQVIEWKNGDTICYREELLPILKQLSKEGLPSLGTILLVISTCKEQFGGLALERTRPKNIMHLLDYQGKHSELESRKSQLENAIPFLEHIVALSPELRTGDNRTWLVYLVFEKVEKRIAVEEASRFVAIFNSGQLDNEIFKEAPPDLSFNDGVINWAEITEIEIEFHHDMQALQSALEAFPTAMELEMAVRSGLKQVPTAAELEMPEPGNGELLQQLEQDPGTTGLVQLTKRLIAALNIPMHAHGSSDQLFGGLSDITNRGNFDRLLLSELAHDDLSLMARLANNEALYLRREELPSKPERQRIVLIDTTLKMWGLPRVFAISAALACAHNNKTNARIMPYALSGNGYKNIDLATKEGIVHALEQLDAALHCGLALTLFMSQQTMHEEDEVFLITEDDSTHSVLFQSILASLKKPVNFLVTVSRSGELRFYEYIKGRKKQLSEARFDLQELLFPATAPKKVKGARKVQALLNAPAFMQYQPCPLYFPASKIKFITDNFYEVKKDHLICVTKDQRVLYWNSKVQGAREVIEYLQSGKRCFGSDGEDTIYFLVYANYMLLYQVNLESGTVQITKLLENKFGVEMVFEEGYFYVKTDKDLFAIEAATAKVHPGKDRIGVFTLMMERNEKAFSNIKLNFFKKFVNDGYTTINTVRSVYVNADGELGFDDRNISLKRYRDLIIDLNRQEVNKSTRISKARAIGAPDMGLPNTNLRFSRFGFADGSEVLADSRGFLHLKSADSSIPEITIVMIMGRPTACWAADGRVCGPPYFTGKTTAASMDITGFYNNYIQRFIDRIKIHATNAEV